MISVQSIVEVEYSEVKSYRGHWEGSHYKKVSVINSWTKWGGARREVATFIEGGVVKDVIPDVWYCQSCGKEQPSVLTPYKIQVGYEWFRACADCLNNGCQPLAKRLTE